MLPEPEPLTAAVASNGNGSSGSPEIEPGGADALRASGAGLHVENGDAEPVMPADRGLDDIGNARRFVDQHGSELRSVPALGGWLVYDGARLAPDERNGVLDRATQTVRAIAEEAAAEADRDRRSALLKHADRSASAQRLQAALKIAASDPRVVVTPRELDADPWLLNATNGTVDLRTGELRPHRPDDLLTRCAGAAYDPYAKAPTWEHHLELVFEGDRSHPAYLQRLVGLAAIGQVLEHVLVILHGDGENGKSTTFKAVLRALGDYGHVAPAELLMQGKRNLGQATPEIADLRGRRLVTISETQQDGRLAVERVKAITGGDALTGRYLHRNPFVFTPSHTVILSTNHPPRVPDDSHAIWRRIAVVPFTARIPESERDPEIDDKLARERDGILAWIVQGALAYQCEGLNPPTAVRAATTEYRETEDTFGAFLAEMTVDEPGTSVQAAELARAYNAWRHETGADELSANALAEKIQAKHYERKRDNKGTRYLGLRLNTMGTFDV